MCKREKIGELGIYRLPVYAKKNLLMTLLNCTNECRRMR